MKFGLILSNLISDLHKSDCYGLKSECKKVEFTQNVGEMLKSTYGWELRIVSVSFEESISHCQSMKRSLVWNERVPCPAQSLIDTANQTQTLPLCGFDNCISLFRSLYFSLFRKLYFSLSCFYLCGFHNCTSQCFVIYSFPSLCCLAIWHNKRGQCCL